MEKKDSVQKMSSQIVFWGALVVVMSIVAFVIYKSKQGQKPAPASTEQVAESGKKMAGVTRVPARTATPLDEYTRYFKSAVYPARSEKFSFDMNYHWFSPRKPWPQGIKFPLVMVLHNSTGKAEAAKYLVQPNMQLEYPAFVVVPVLPAGIIWAAPASFPGHAALDKVATLRKGLFAAMDLAEQFSKDHPVDMSRIYVIGCADGGMGAFGAAKDYSNMVAGAISVSGGWSVDDAPELLRTPLLAIHGGGDTTLPPDISRTVSNVARNLGGPVQYIEFPKQGHDCTAAHQYSPSVWKWLFAQRKLFVPQTPPAPAKPAAAAPAAP